MQPFVRGQRAKLSALSDQTRFNLQIALSAPSGKIYDFVCFGADARGQLVDDAFMVFFNQKRAPADAIFLEELQSQSAKFEFDLEALPPHIERLVFTVSVDGIGTMRELHSGSWTLNDANASSTKPVAQYRFAGTDFSTEGALMLAEIYRKDGLWRIWAQGQGFAGDLSALLKFFGGEESETAPNTPPVQPPPPISVPLVSSIPTAPIPNVLPPAPGALQATIDGAPSGATIQLPRGEYRGPIVISRPITIEGIGAVIWAQSGPVVRVQSEGVSLRGVQIEVTDADDSPDSDVALQVEVGKPELQNVGVRGRVTGIDESASDWNLPSFLDLGELAPRAPNSYVFALEIPVACRLKTNVSGLQLTPNQIEAGRSDVEIVATGIGADTFLAGQIEVESAGIVRAIPLGGRVGGPNSQPVTSRRIGSN